MRNKQGMGRPAHLSEKTAIKRRLSLASAALTLSAAIVPSIGTVTLASELESVTTGEESIAQQMMTSVSTEIELTQPSTPAAENLSETSGESQTIESETAMTEESQTEVPTTEMETTSSESTEVAENNEIANPVETVAEEPKDLLTENFMLRGMNPATFINQVSLHAQDVASRNDLYASVMIAQAILESGWGGSSLANPPNHNLFGIKGSYQGQSVIMQTQEVINGQWITIQDSFRKYPSYRESFEDNARVLKNSLYMGAWKSRTNSYRDATAWLTGRYATDPSYNHKLNSLIENYNLTRFDTGAPSGGLTHGGEGGGLTQGGGNGGSLVPQKPTTPPSTSTNKYTVVAGDTLYGIGIRFGVSVAQLKSWNHLTSDLILVGQVLQVRAGQPAPNKPAPSTPTPNNTTPQRYTVVAGDTLYGIGRRFGVSVAQLKGWNGLHGDTIYVGQTLIVKQNSATVKPAPQKPAPTKPNAPQAAKQTHRVVSGDTLYAIGRRYGVSVAQLKNWNGLHSDLIYVGQTLTVRLGQGQASGSVPTQSKPQTPSNTQKSYTVVRGDSLYRIALNHGVSVAHLKQTNGLKNDLIFVGQKLVIQGGKLTSSYGVTAKSKAQGSYYKVVPGDSLWKISQKHGLTVGQLKGLNSLSSDLIVVGQSLRIA